MRRHFGQPIKIFLYCTVLLLWSTVNHAANLPRVFIVHSYDSDNFVSLPQDNGLVQGLAEYGYVDGETVNIKRFYMDTKRTFTRPGQIAARGKEALAEIRTFAPDLVITVDDNAAGTVMLPLIDTDIPVVFTGINNLPEAYNRQRKFMRNRISPGHNVTGVYEKLYIGKSVQLMEDIVPDLRKIIFIIDDSPTGNAIRLQMERELAADESDVLYSIRQISSFADYKELIRRIDADPEIGAYYPVAVRLSREDGTTITGRDIMLWTLEHARKPAIAVTYFACKFGMFGGVSVDFTAMGRQAGHKGSLILKGSRAGDISIDDAAEYALIFNIARARQLGITIAPELLASADDVYETMQLPVEPKLFHVLIVQSNGKGLGAGADVETGVLAELAASGFVEGKNLQISRVYMQARRKYWTPEQMHNQGLAALEEVRRLDPDLVITLDDPAVKEVMLPLVDSRYPVLFGSMMLPPEFYNTSTRFMETLARPGHNVSGVTGVFQLKKSLEAMQVLLPKAKSIVLIISGNFFWRTEMTRILREKIAECRERCRLVSIRVESAATFAEFKQLVLQFNADPSVDVISAVYPVGLTREDGSVSPLPETLDWLFANQHKPGFTFCAGWVKYGYLLSAAIDFEATGRQLGQQVVRVLWGTDPGDIPIENPSDTYLAVNLARARQLGLDIPVDVLEAARKVYYTMEPELAR